MDTLGMIFQGAKWNRLDPVGLTRLNLAGNRFGRKGVANIQDYLEMAVCLRELSLMKCETDLTPILDAIAENKDLAKNFRRLNLSQNRFKADSAKALGKVLQKVEALKFLFLSQCNLDANLLKPIIVALAQNEIAEVDLNLSMNNLQGYLADMMQKLKDRWQNCLSGLIIEDCELSVEDIKSICEVLCEKNKELKLISLDLNFKTNKKLLNIPATGALGKLITNTELEVLSINGNKPSRKRSLTGGEMRPIFDALKTKNKLTNLYIQGNRIGMEGLGYLKGSLAKNMTLQVIDLEDNKIDAEMAYAIMDLARPGPLTSILPMHALNRLKGEMNAKQKVKLKDRYSVARGILKENQQKLAKTRHERGVNIRGSNRTSVLRGAKLVQLSLSHDVKNQKLSSKLFSDSAINDLAGFKDVAVGEDSADDFLKLKSTKEHTIFVVKREAIVKDSAGKTKGQLQAGAKVTGELSSKRRKMRKSVKTSEVDIYEIHIIQPVDGWIQFHTFKGDVILEELISENLEHADLFDEGFHSFSATSAPEGLDIEGSSIVVKELAPGSQLADHCDIGDILVKIEDEDVGAPAAALESLGKQTWPVTLTFSRPNHSDVSGKLNARVSVAMKPKSPNKVRKPLSRQSSFKKPKAPPKREAGSQTDLDGEVQPEESMEKRDPSLSPKKDEEEEEVEAAEPAKPEPAPKEAEKEGAKEKEVEPKEPEKKEAEVELKKEKSAEKEPVKEKPAEKEKEEEIEVEKVESEPAPDQKEEPKKVAKPKRKVEKKVEQKESDDEEEDAEAGDLGPANTNAAQVQQDALELKAKDAAAAAAKKEKDKNDRLNQKNKAEERKKKAQEKAAKGERKTGR